MARSSLHHQAELLAPPEPANYNTAHQGGLTRSMGHLQLPGTDMYPVKNDLRSGLSPPPGSLPHATDSSSCLGVSPTASIKSNSTGHSTNSGFVITSRRKQYQPPAGPAAQQHGSASPSPPQSGQATPAGHSRSGTLSHVSSLHSRRGSSPDGTTTTTKTSSPSAGTTPMRKVSNTSSTASSIRRRVGSSSNGINTVSSASAPPKTTLTLSSSIDSQGRRMVNQYVRLKTIGQGSHGKVWLCAEPTSQISDLDDDSSAGGDHASAGSSGPVSPEEVEARARRKGKARQRLLAERWEDEIDAGEVKYCAIKSVAREGASRGKSLRAARGRKASSQGSAGIGQDDKIKREVAIMKRLDHPNIVRLKEVIDDPKSKKVFMVLEFMAGGQVVWQDENRRPTMTVDEARRTFRDVVLGLEYLHYQGIIHRDIKPANLLWTEDHAVVKISDFGVSHVSEALLRASPLDNTSECKGDDDKLLRKTAGSPAFFAPELCNPVESTPTPSTAEANTNYFPSGARASHESSATSVSSSPPLSPNGLPLSSTYISRPLPAANPAQPRVRAVIGKAIDVWALGITLYCLLFGDTPFMANTEYELYNVIVRHAIRVPERMGKEQAWTGVPTKHDWEGKGDGEEGREVVDLLGRLLEKDPGQRITLDQVKKHPWVLRNLSSSPDSWLCDTDPVKIETVQITEEDVECATRQRGSIDSLPPIRNRPGIRRALNAALVRFPAFARIKSQRRTIEDEDGSGRSRSKSASSNSQSNGYEPTNVTLSRYPTDEVNRKKSSLDFGENLRRIISGDGALTGGSGSRSASPAGTIGRGGWGNFQRRRDPSNPTVIDASASPHTASPATMVSPTLASPTLSSASGFVPNGMPQLSRSVSASSVASRGLGHLFSGSRKNSERSDSTSSAGRGTSTPSSDGETPLNGRRTITRVLSKLGGGERRGAGRRKDPESTVSGRRSSAVSDEKHVSAAEQASVNAMNTAVADSSALPDALIERFEASGEKFDSFGRAVRPSTVPKPMSTSEMTMADDDDDDMIDLTEFEYSESDEDEEDDDYDEDFLASPIDHANGVSGWHSAFANFNIGVTGDHRLLAAAVHEVDDHDEFDLKEPISIATPATTLEDSTPRQSSRTVNEHGTPLSNVPPLLLHRFPANSPSPTHDLKLGIVPSYASSNGFSSSQQYSRSPTSPTSTSPRDGSIRGVSMDPPSSASRRMDAFGDEDEDDDAGIIIAPRRKRATTVNGAPVST